MKRILSVECDSNKIVTLKAARVGLMFNIYPEPLSISDSRSSGFAIIKELLK